MKGPGGSCRIGQTGGVSLSPNHPILKLENKIGKFSHLLPRELIADRAYWSKIERLVRERVVVGTSDRRSIPSLMLPIFKRMIETPFDLLVSIPRAGDPLAYALFKMAEYSERIGASLAKMPKHESFGRSGLSASIVNLNFLLDKECKNKIDPKIRARVLRVIEDLSAHEREVLFRGNSYETFVGVLDKDFESLLLWFMGRSGSHFAKVAIPVLAELVKETAAASVLQKAKRILLVDDFVNDFVAYDSVHYPLSVFAPEAQFEVGLLSGTGHVLEELDPICGCFHGAWVMMKKGEWTGEAAGGSSSQLGREAMALLWPTMKMQMPVEEEPERTAIFSLLIYGILYQRGLVFSQGASWGRKKIWQRFEGRYGEGNLSTWQALMESKITPQFIEELRRSSPLFARMTLGKLEIDRAVEKLFGDDLNGKLLKPYLRSEHGYEEMRPISDLLVLINKG